MHMFGDYGVRMGGGGMIFMLLFWVLIIVGVFYLIKILSDKGKGDGQEESATEILKKRYAKGEINRAEYEKIKKDLQN